ncbi:MAG TPA: type II toxin-antitoxin system VapC family toxin [Brevundimonas sp.]|uniref:type II toxin-antitoxin system VapC family toxin n=1 Tax=Brevundimonas sp. TaxID=1871086 RepID=UPI002EDA42B3
MSAVFDASVVVKWFLDDPLASAARDVRLALRPAVAPDLMLIEVANAFRRYVVQGELEAGAALENLSVIKEVVELFDHAPLLDEAFSLACRFNHSMTDCLYAVLARRLNLPLVTADGKLARKLGSLDGLEVRMIGS